MDFKIIKNKISLPLIVLFFVLLPFFMLSFLFLNSSQKKSPLSSNLCKRSTPYPMAPEFQRALNLIYQRFSKVSVAPKDPRGGKLLSNNFNCIHIEYASLNEQDSNDRVEGLFFPDPQSTSQDLHILVDSSYRDYFMHYYDYNDLLMAVLLSHELTHAYQFLKANELGETTSCVQSEVEAFNEEIAFLSFLKPTEVQTLANTLSVHRYENPYSAIIELIRIKGDAYGSCSGQEPCYSKTIQQKIEDFVTSNPGYQKQCSKELNLK